MKCFYTGTQCGEPCANQILFDPSKSSTYVNYNETYEIAFETGGGVNPITSDSEYVLWLLAGADTVTVDGIASNVSLYTIINQTEAFAPDPYSGIQGSVFWKRDLTFALKPVLRYVIASARFLRGIGPARFAG